MDCCLPHEGSGPSGSPAVKAALAVLTVLAAAIDAVEPPAQTILASLPFAPLEAAGPRLHSRLSVFLI